MKTYELLEQALRKARIPVKYYEYEGAAREYIVYNEEVEQPTNYADNKPQNDVVWWQVHIFAPKDFDFRKRKEDVKRYLLEDGFTITDVATLYEKETKTIHVVINCHMEEREDK